MTDALARRSGALFIRTSLVPLALLLSVAACSAGDDVGTLLTEPELPSALPPKVRDGEPLQTDSLAYTAIYKGGEGAYRMYGFRVIVRFTNSRPVPVYLANCFPTDSKPMYGVSLVDAGAEAGSWGSIFNRAWACVGHDRQLQVLPGATRIDTLDLLGPNAFDGITKKPYGTFDGRVRIIYAVQTCRGDGECRLPYNDGVSNVVDVKVMR